MLIIHCNGNHIKEREYIYDVVFKDFWQINYKIQYEQRQDIALEMDGQSLFLADTFFQQEESDWLKQQSLPKQPLRRVILPKEYLNCATERDLPAIYIDSESSVLFDGAERYCTLDILGSAFFMLSRYEELVKKERDKYERFPAMASLAYQENFLERPIVNEYLEILWHWMKKKWPRLERKKYVFEIMPTHDIDSPFWAWNFSGYQRCRMLAGDLIKRNDIPLMLRRLRIFLEAAVGVHGADPHNTFDRIMDISEKYEVTSHFYVMTAQGRSKIDGNYDVMSAGIRKLVKKILVRGHKFGVHVGFGSFEKKDFVRADADKLRELIAKENLGIDKFGGRQHYLQWKAPDTWKHYEDTGLLYDTTLSYADHIGFRCGICYDYPVYNAVVHERYNLREYPLEVMECSGLDYMGLSHAAMRERCLALKHKVKKYGGTFVILWHNTRFIENEETMLYEDVLNG